MAVLAPAAAAPIAVRAVVVAPAAAATPGIPDVTAAVNWAFMATRAVVATTAAPPRPRTPAATTAVTEPTMRMGPGIAPTTSTRDEKPRAPRVTIGTRSSPHRAARFCTLSPALDRAPTRVRLWRSTAPPKSVCTTRCSASWALRRSAAVATEMLPVAVITAP